VLSSKAFFASISFCLTSDGLLSVATIGLFFVPILLTAFCGKAFLSHNLLRSDFTFVSASFLDFFNDSTVSATLFINSASFVFIVQLSIFSMILGFCFLIF